jgi:3-phenylpropionate/trans-cinnamate dioxygenase ferredoxin subunit
MSSRYVVAKASEVAPGSSRQVSVAGRDVALFNVKGEFFAIANRCPHEGASLCKGQMVGLAESDGPGHYRMVRQGEMVRCPWHGWEFDVRTGRSYCDPARTRVKSFDVHVEKGEAIEGPYRAETFKVIREEDYVILEV